jgi:signal transduction histidine kinase
MPAAMSHDLRTPFNRLRLQTEFIEDREQQRRCSDLEAMNLMIDQTLAFARGDAQQQPRRPIELGVLVEDVCEDAADAGAYVSYPGPRGVNVSCRPIVLAARSRTSDTTSPDRIVILIEDNGAGIPPEECETAFTPFYRLELLAQLGCWRLGLNIARVIARERGGDDLCASLELSAASDMHPARLS